MGSKRPEQVHKDLLTTDAKTRTDDEHIHEQDKRLLHTKRGKLAAPMNRENPALRALKQRKQAGEDGGDAG